MECTLSYVDKTIEYMTLSHVHVAMSGRQSEGNSTSITHMVLLGNKYYEETVKRGQCLVSLLNYREGTCCSCFCPGRSELLRNAPPRD